MNTKKYPNNLRKYRLKRKLTQQFVAQRIGHKSANRVSTWESGLAKPSLQNLLKLSELYGEPIEKLYPIPRDYSNNIRTKKPVLDDEGMPMPDEPVLQDMSTEEQLGYLAGLIVEAYFESRKKK